MTDIEIIKKESLEDEVPMFTDADIQYYYDKNNADVEATIYELLIIKSENSTISVSGLNTQDTSSYFKRLASRHKSFNTGILKGC